jgi:hypothetical protein
MKLWIALCAPVFQLPPIFKRPHKAQHEAHDAAERQEHQALRLHQDEEGLARGGGHEAEFPPSCPFQPPRGPSRAHARDEGKFAQARSTLHWALQGQINTSQGKRASRRIAFASDCGPSPNSLATNQPPMAAPFGYFGHHVSRRSDHGKGVCSAAWAFAVAQLQRLSGGASVV